MADQKAGPSRAFDDFIRRLPQGQLKPAAASTPKAFDDMVRASARAEEPEALGSSERTRLLVQAAKDPENQKMLGRLALEVGVGVGASYLSGGAAIPATAGRLARMGTALLRSRSTAAGVGEAAGSLASETFDPSEEPFKRAAATGLIGATGERIGGAVARGVRGGTKLEPGAREALAQLEAAGGSISPGQLSTNKAVDTLQNIAESSLFGGGVLRKMKQRGVELATEAVDAFVGAFRSVARKEDVVDLVRDTIIDRSDAFRANGRALYASLDDAVAEAGQSARVDMTGFVDDLTEQSKEFGNQGARSVLSEWNKFVEANEITDIGSVSFAAAQDIRSALLGIGRQGQDLIASGAQVTGKRLSPVVDKAMAKAARLAGPDILPLFRKAGAFWKEGATRFNSRLMKSLTKDEPRAVFEAMGSNPKTIRMVRNTIDNPDTWREVQGQFLLDAVNRSSDEVGVLSGKKLLANLKRFGGEGLTSMFSGGELGTLRGLGRTLQISQGGIGKNVAGGIFIQLKQAGAVTQAAGFVLGASGTVGLGTAATIVVGPALMARILANKTVSHWLTVGIKSRPGSQQAIRAFGQLSAWVAKQAIEGSSEQGTKPRGLRDRRPSLRFSATLQGPAREPLALSRLPRP